MGAAGQSLEDGAQSRTDARVSAPRQRTRDVKLSRCAVRLDLGSSGQLGPEMLPLSASLSFCILFDTLRKINLKLHVYKVNVKATVKPVKPREASSDADLTPQSLRYAYAYASLALHVRVRVVPYTRLKISLYTNSRRLSS